MFKLGAGLQVVQGSAGYIYGVSIKTFPDSEQAPRVEV